MASHALVPLPENLAPTLATLHQYAHAIGAVPRVHAMPHDKWWHVSLSVTERGLETDAMPLPNGGSCTVHMDLTSHQVVVEADGGAVATIAMGDGMTGTAMGDAVLAAAGGLGLEGEYDRSRFESDEAREYDPAAAAGFFATLSAIRDILAIHRDRLGDSVGPLQLWPHGFDLAFEWFGTRVEEYEEHGEVSRLSAQCNFGFYPSGRAYFYANPWPFESEALLAVDLPSGAEWHTAGWQGSILHYDELAGDPTAEKRILEFFAAVFAAAAPTLTG